MSFFYTILVMSLVMNRLKNLQDAIIASGYIGFIYNFTEEVKGADKEN